MLNHHLHLLDGRLHTSYTAEHTAPSVAKWAKSPANSSQEVLPPGPKVEGPGDSAGASSSPLALVRNGNTPQVENTLYRLSIYGLAKGSNFFASTFAIDAGDSPEGKSDEHPIILPSTVTCAEFDVYLWFGVQ